MQNMLCRLLHKFDADLVTDAHNNDINHSNSNSAV